LPPLFEFASLLYAATIVADFFHVKLLKLRVQQIPANSVRVIDP
jgi:hypothetical protein